MSTKSYMPEKMEPPVTPSRGVNEKLKELANKCQDSPAMVYLTQAVYMYFKLAILIHDKLNTVKAIGDKCDARKMWFLSVGTACSLVMIGASVIYNLIMAASFLFVWTLYYTAVLAGLASIGVSGWACMSFQPETSSPKSSSVPRPKVSPQPTPTIPDSNIDNE